MKPEDSSIAEVLLEYKLGLLPSDRSSEIASRLDSDFGLRSQAEQLDRVLNPLGLWTVPPPQGLAERVLRQIGTTGASVERYPGSRATPPRTMVFPVRLRELVAVAACVGALIGVGIPTLGNLRSRADEARCSDNLATILHGTTLYQASFGGSLPYAGYVEGGAWLPGTGGAARRVDSNSRHPFLLLRLGFSSRPDVFVCGACPKSRPMGLQEVSKSGDFGQSCQITYDTHNLSGLNPVLRPREVIAYASDPNPLFVGARFNPQVDPTRANSPVHGGRCQSVVFLDGRVVRQRTPIAEYGARKDNIWLAGDIRTYDGTEVPLGDGDAFLVPGCPRNPGDSLH